MSRWMPGIQRFWSSAHSIVEQRLREIQRQGANLGIFEVRLSRSKLESRYRECASLYRGDILCMNQAVPVQEKGGAM